MSRRRKSVFDKALGNKRRNKGGGGLGGAFDDARRKKRKGHRELSDFLGFDQKPRRRSREWRLSRMVGQTLRDRMTPTERMQAQDAVDRAMDDDHLSAFERDETLTGNESFIRRLVRLIRERGVR